MEIEINKKEWSYTVKIVSFHPAENYAINSASLDDNDPGELEYEVLSIVPDGDSADYEDLLTKDDLDKAVYEHLTDEDIY